MNKIVPILLSVISFCLLTGCKEHMAIEQFEFPVDFKSEATVYIGKNLMLSCSIIKTGKQILTIVVNEPKDLKGLTVSYAEGGYGISYNELMMNSQLPILPDSSFFFAILDVLKQISNNDALTFKGKEDGMLVFCGNSTSGKFNIYIDKKNNRICRLVFVDMDITVNFI